jgi:hypothetical protein
MKKLLLACIAALFVSAASVMAAVPHMINYQGYLTDPQGEPLDTTVAMTFAFYDAATLGTQLWIESQPSMTVQGGLFNALLGSVSAIPDSAFADTNVWLGITVGGDSEMSPRTRVVSVAYAYRVGTVDGANGGTISGKVNIGSGNTNTGTYAFVAGLDNNADGNYSSVGGGQLNSATGNYASVGGGIGDYANGNYATVPGGNNNLAEGRYSFAAGRLARAYHDGCFVWGDTTAVTITTSAPNQIRMRGSGGTIIYSNAAMNSGVSLAAGGGSWSSVSDSTKKRTIRLVDTGEILDKVARLPIKQWSYKSQDPSIEHIGPDGAGFLETFPCWR